MIPSMKMFNAAIVVIISMVIAIIAVPNTLAQTKHVVPQAESRLTKNKAGPPIVGTAVQKIRRILTVTKDHIMIPQAATPTSATPLERCPKSEPGALETGTQRLINLYTGYERRQISYPPRGKI